MMMMIRATLISLVGFALACGSRGQPSSDGSGEASATGASSTTTDGDSEDATDLPPGCGDGIVDPEQFCFEPVLVPGLAQGWFSVGLDLDGDGRDELIVGYDAGYQDKGFGEYPCDSGRCLSVFSFENGIFVHRQTLDTSTYDGAVSIIDVDGDRRRDLLLVSGPIFSVFRNLGDGLSEREVIGLETVAGGHGYGIAAPVDPDQDGVADYLLPWADDAPQPYWADHLQLRRKVGDEYVPVGPRFDVPYCSRVTFGAVGDLTGDGVDDAVLLSDFSLGEFCDHDAVDPEAVLSAFVLFANPDTGLMEEGPRLPTGREYGPSRAWLADVNQDGHLDIVLQVDGAEDAIILNRGDRTFEDVRVFGQVQSGEQRFRNLRWVADFNGDGRPDFLGGSAHEEAIGFLNDPLNTRKVVPHEGHPMNGADVNGDGIADLIRWEDSDDPGVKRVYVLVSRP